MSSLTRWNDGRDCSISFSFFFFPYFRSAWPCLSPVDDGEKFGECVARRRRFGPEMHVGSRRIGRGQNGRPSGAHAHRPAAAASTPTANASPLSVGCQSNYSPRASFSQSSARYYYYNTTRLTWFPSQSRDSNTNDHFYFHFSLFRVQRQSTLAVPTIQSKYRALYKYLHPGPSAKRT